MSSFQDLLVFFGICLIYEISSEIIDNDTLIYDWDPHHKIELYCYFAPMEEIQNRYIGTTCTKKNLNMRHVTAEGVITYPYMPHGSNNAFILKCENIPHGQLLHECTRYVHKTCSYTCNGNDTHIIKCNLMGPWNNVTAEWSVKNTCPPSIKSLIEGDTSWNMMKVLIVIAVVAACVIISAIVFLCRWKCKYCQRHSVVQVSVEEPVPRVIPEDGDVGGDKDSQLSPLIPAPVPSTENGEEVVENETKIVSGDNTITESSQKSSSNRTTSRTVPADTEHLAELYDVDLRFNYNYNIQDCLGNSKGNNKKEISDEIKLELSTLNIESLDKIGIPKDTGKFSNKSTSQICIADKPAKAGNCNTSIRMLNDQKSSYRKKLRPQLEVIRGRERHQALIGYMEENEHKLGYPPNEIKMFEKAYESRLDEKISDMFLQRLAEYDIKIGTIVDYFYVNGNREAINVILEVHTNCEWCEQFRNLR